MQKMRVFAALSSSPMLETGAGQCVVYDKFNFVQIFSYAFNSAPVLIEHESLQQNC